ncbi:MAG: mechanosensitive ion channel family protein [Acholeplasmataceae bacterium]|jgi:small-conductance mechanosensitive channel
MKLFEFLRDYLQGVEQADGTFAGGLGLSVGFTNIIIGTVFGLFMIVVTVIGLFILKKLISRSMNKRIKRIKAEQERLDKIRKEGAKKTITDYNSLVFAEIRGDSPYQYVDVSKRAETISKSLYNIVAAIVWVVVIIIILDGYGVNIIPLITGAGIVGIAVAFGSQEFIKDFISGLFNIFENTYSVGELVEINGFIGTVKEIGLRTTKIENWRGDYFIINNGKINSVVNRSRDTSIAIIDVILSNKVVIEDVNQAILEFIDNYESDNPALYEQPKYAGLVDTSLISYTFRVMATTAPASHIGVERQIRMELFKFLEAKGFEMPDTIVVSK